IDSDGVLTISGKGDMKDYEFVDSSPWSFSKVKKLIIKEGVTSIGKRAFYKCTMLSSVSLPDSLISIGSGAFSWCEKLTNVSLPDSLISIKTEAFDRCESLTSITLPKNVKNVERGAFDSCEDLESILVDESNSSYISLDGVLYSKDMKQLVAYPGAKAGALIVPDGVVTIGDYACKFNKSLTSVTLPDSVTSIGKQAFDECKNLTSITFGNGLTSIGDCAFRGCPFTSITLPNSLTTIEETAFYCCRDLTSVEFGNRITSIGATAFNRCELLETVYYKGSAAKWATISIGEENDELLNAQFVFSNIDEEINNSSNVADENKMPDSDDSDTSSPDNSDTDADNNSPNSHNKGENKDDSNTGLIVLCATGAILAVAGIAAFIFIKVKK
ncbi:MAG: leucine-rich repeat protein, partial [Clostridia bacterium]|nr:leucine-rich repeat protein [Clostridia bacterium]